MGFERSNRNITVFVKDASLYPHIIVTYNNGESEDLKTALNTGRVAVVDLDQFGIECTTEVKDE